MKNISISSSTLIIFLSLMLSACKPTVSATGKNSVAIESVGDNKVVIEGKEYTLDTSQGVNISYSGDTMTINGKTIDEIKKAQK